MLRDRDSVSVAEAVSVAVSDIDGVGVLLNPGVELTEGDAPWLAELVFEREKETLVLREGDEEPLGLTLALDLAVAEGVSVALTGEHDCVRDCDRDGDSEALTLMLMRLTVCDDEMVAEAATERDGVGLTGLGDRDGV